MAFVCDDQGARSLVNGLRKVKLPSRKGGWFYIREGNIFGKSSRVWMSSSHTSILTRHAFECGNEVGNISFHWAIVLGTREKRGAETWRIWPLKFDVITSGEHTPGEWHYICLHVRLFLWCTLIIHKVPYSKARSYQVRTVLLEIECEPWVQIRKL